MPGNDSGDRVHNFFPQDHLLQGPHHQQTLEGNWSVANNNFLVGGQTGLPNTSTKHVNIQHSVTDRGQASHALHGQSGLSFTQTNSNFAQNLFQRQQLSSNGYMFGNNVNQTRQDGSTILAVDSIPDQRNFVSRGLSMYGSPQGPGPQHQKKSLARSETSESPVAFNLFGNQQQMPHPQSSMLQSFQKQHSGYSDMQQLQQQIMWKKMQELQRQHQLPQSDGRQQNAVNPISPFSKQLTGGYPSAVVNAPPRADSHNSHRQTESENTNWLQRASSVVQGSPNGFVNSANHGQAQSSIDLGAQQGDQSLYGETYSESRGNLTQFSKIAVEKPSMEQIAAFSNNVPANKYQVQEEPMISRLGFPGENPFCNTPGRPIQQVNSVKRIASSEEIHHEVAPSQDKTLSEDVASQNEVSLHPTEARILYGSDDNIWAAFGKSLDDCGDAGGPLDNFQSGTWSALMQSAVAETSSSDVGQQETLGDLNLQNTSSHIENKISSHSRRQETSFNNDLPSPLNSSVLNPDISSTNNNHQNILGVQQLGNKLSYESDQTQGCSSQREGSNILGPGVSQNAVSDMRPTLGSVLPFGGPETNQGIYRGPWPPTQYAKSSGYNTLESTSRFLDVAIHERENLSLHSQGYEQKAGTKGEVGHGGFLFASSPMPSLTAEVEHAKSFSGNTAATRGGFTMNNAAVAPNLSTTQFNESGQAVLWRNPNPMIISYGSGSMDRSHHYVSPENQSVESSLNSRGKANTITSEVENCKRNDSSNNSYCSDLSRNNSSGGVKETVMSDVGDSHSFLSGKQKYFNHNAIGKTSMPPLKFQIHPIENLDEDSLVRHGAKHSSHSLMSQQSTDYEGYKGFSQIPKGSVDFEKGRPADKKDADRINSTRENFPAHIQNANVPFNQHVDMCTPLKDTPPSNQNMLELLHKIDQLRGHGLLMHSGPSGGQLPETENWVNSASRLQQNHTSTSQGFGLQLGPPSHMTALPDHSSISQGSLQKGNTYHQSQDVSEVGERSRSQLPSSPAVQSSSPLSERTVREFDPSRSALPEQGNHAFTHKIPGSYLSTSNSDFTRSRSQFQYQQMVKEGGQISKNQQNFSNSIQNNDYVRRSSFIGQTTEPSFHNASWNPQHDDSDLLKGTCNQISGPESHSRGTVFQTSAKDVSVSQAIKGNAQQGTSFGQPHLLSSQIHRASSNALQLLHQPNVLESNSFTPDKHGEQESIAGPISPSVSGSSSMNKGSPAQQDSTGKINMAQRDELRRPEPASNNYRDCSPSNSVTMQTDLEAFGRSLMPSNSSHQNYSLLHQMGIVKSAEINPNERARKRMKSLGDVEEYQQLISKTAKSSDNVVSQHASVSSGDSKILSFSELKDNAGSKAYSQHGNVISQNIHASSQDNSQVNHDGNNPTPVKVNPPYISPQMTPSWLNQHGGFRNGQMLTEFGARRGAASKTVEPLFSHDKTSSGLHMANSNEQIAVAGVGPGQIGNIQQSHISISVAVEPEPLVLNVTRPKKRERATFQLTSWRKELSQRSRNPQTISMAEVYWAKAANRLMEKIEDEVKFSEDRLPMFRAKRRITLTTQLMQQLLRPPKSAILNSEAELNYDGVAYSVSRLALGKACGLLPNPNTDSDKPHHVVSLFSGKNNELEKVNDQHLSKLVEGFMGRAQKLESEFLRLDKRASLIDVRSECQELEKFSVINRFAKFHGRGPAEAGDASAISGSANALRPYPQRYVTALPVPRNLPDAVHCLSL